MLKFIQDTGLPIGVDIGTTSVKMAQMNNAPGNLELVAAGMVNIPPELQDQLNARLEHIGKGIQAALKTSEFRGRQCILSLPATDTFIQHVKVPKLPAAEIKTAVRSELQGKLPFPMKQAVMRHVVAGDLYDENDPKQEVIVIAVARTTLEAYLDMANRAKLNVTGINVESCAIVECFGRLFHRTSDAVRTILFVDMGVGSTQVTLSHGNRMVFARNLPAGSHRLDQAVAKGLSAPLEQAGAMRRNLTKSTGNDSAKDELYRLLDDALDSIADEITQCLRYYESVFRNQNVERVIFVGGQAYDTRICQLLAQRLNLPAQVGDPLVQVKRINGAGVSIGLDRHEPHPNWAVAVGLSLNDAPAA